MEDLEAPLESEEDTDGEEIHLADTEGEGDTVGELIEWAHPLKGGTGIGIAFYVYGAMLD